VTAKFGPKSFEGGKYGHECALLSELGERAD
jgi:hypothetical protein